MKDRNLNDSINEHFEQVSLSHKQLEKLESLIAKRTSNQETNKKKSWASLFQSPRFALVAFLAVFLINGSIWIANYPQPYSIDSIALEVAKNHLKDHPSDIKSTSLAEIGTFLSKLEFSLGKPNRLSFSEFMGGRYCTLAGESAAQVKAKSIDGISGTLYITDSGRFPDNFLSKLKKPASKDPRGVKVTVWQEKGLLYAFAHNN